MAEHEARTLSEFIHRLTANFISRGYFFCATGEIPEAKDPSKTDAKIIGQYDVGLSRWTKARRRKRGLASVQYLRFGRRFVILATHGAHQFFECEAKNIRDVRRTPLRIGRYAVGHRQENGKGKAFVRITQTEIRGVRSRLVAHAVSAADVANEIRSLGLLRYAGVWRQVVGLVKVINKKRKRAGLEPVNFKHCFPGQKSAVLVGSNSVNSASHCK